ncbi:MAG: hypothetical protein ACYC8T_06670 [Myxococcaceae bacterium]
MAKDILSVLEGKWEDGSRPADLYAAYVAKKPRDYLGAIVEGLGSKKKRVQGGCAELASLLSAGEPKLLYPHVELFARNLHAKEPILRWEAVCTLGNLAAVDSDKRIPKLLPVMTGLLGHQSIVLQGHAVKALAKLARANPPLGPRVFEALAGSTQFFAGSRVGYIVEAMGELAGDEALVPRIREFLAPYAGSEHAPVARKAKKALKAVQSRG